MAKDFLEIITEVLLSERLGEELEKDEQYKAAIKEEARIYELLNSSLNEEQQNMFKDYFDTSSSRESIIESVIYKQGMRDLLSLFKSLSPDGESKLLRTSEKYGVE